MTFTSQTMFKRVRGYSGESGLVISRAKETSLAKIKKLAVLSALLLASCGSADGIKNGGVVSQLPTVCSRGAESIESISNEFAAQHTDSTVVAVPFKSTYVEGTENYIALYYNDFFDHQVVIIGGASDKCYEVQKKIFDDGSKALLVNIGSVPLNKPTIYRLIFKPK